MDGVEFKMTGLDVIEQKLEQLPVKAAREALRAGLKAGGGIFQNEMEARVARGWHHFSAAAFNAGRKSKIEPDRVHGQIAEVYGYLSTHIEVRATVTGDLEGAVTIGPAKPGYWAHFLEYGTSKMAAKPFGRPAFEDRKEDVVEEFAIETKAAIVRAGLPIG